MKKNSEKCKNVCFEHMLDSLSEKFSKIHILLNNFFISDSISTKMVPKWPPGPCHQSYVVFVFVGGGG